MTDDQGSGSAQPAGAVDLGRVRGQILAEAGCVAAVVDVIDGSFGELVENVATVSGKVITTAVGNSGAIAERLAHLLSLAGVPALFLDANQALHGSIGAVGPDDLLLALSKGGVTEEVVQCAMLAGQAGARVIAVTEEPDSPLAGQAAQVVALPPSSADPIGAVGLGSALAQAAWGDALVYSALLVRSVSPDELVARHPRGLVGKLAAQGKLGAAADEGGPE